MKGRERRGRGGVGGSRWCDWVGGSASLPSPPGALLMPPARPAPRAMPRAPAAARGSRLAAPTWRGQVRFVARVLSRPDFWRVKKRRGAQKKSIGRCLGPPRQEGLGSLVLCDRTKAGRREEKHKTPRRTGVTRGVRGSKMDGSARRLVGRAHETNTGGNTGCTAGGPRGPKMGSPLSACLGKWRGGWGGGYNPRNHAEGVAKRQYEDAASLPPPPPPLPGDCRRLHRELHVSPANGRGERNGRAVFGREPPAVLAVRAVSRHPFLLVDSLDG